MTPKKWWPKKLDPEKKIKFHFVKQTQGTSGHKWDTPSLLAEVSRRERPLLAGKDTPEDHH